MSFCTLHTVQDLTGPSLTPRLPGVTQASREPGELQTYHSRPLWRQTCHGCYCSWVFQDKLFRRKSTRWILSTDIVSCPIMTESCPAPHRITHSARFPHKCRTLFCMDNSYNANMNNQTTWYPRILFRCNLQGL